MSMEGVGPHPGSSIPRQLPLSPMMVFSVRIEFANVAAVQSLHDADAREHRRPARRRDQDQGWPLRGIVNDRVGKYITKLPKAEHESPRPICLQRPPRTNVIHGVVASRWGVTAADLKRWLLAEARRGLHARNHRCRPRYLQRRYARRCSDSCRCTPNGSYRMRSWCSVLDTA
jgi:hypothetical protein